MPLPRNQVKTFRLTCRIGGLNHFNLTRYGSTSHLTNSHLDSIIALLFLLLAKQPNVAFEQSSRQQQKKSTPLKQNMPFLPDLSLIVVS